MKRRHFLRSLIAAVALSPLVAQLKAFEQPASDLDPFMESVETSSGTIHYRKHPLFWTDEMMKGLPAQTIRLP